MRRFVLMIIPLLFLLVSCSKSEGELFSVPDYSVDEGAHLVVMLSDYTDDSVRAPVRYSLISGKGTVVGSEYRFSPGPGDAGGHDVKVLMQDAKGKDIEASFKVIVRETQVQFALNIPDMAYAGNERFEIDLSEHTDKEGWDSDRMTFELIEGPGELKRGTILSVDETVPEGSHFFSVGMRDNSGSIAKASFVIEITRPDEEFRAVNPVFETVEGKVFSLCLFELVGSSLSEELHFSIIEGPGLIYRERTFYYYPASGESGDRTVVIEVYDTEEVKRREESFVLSVVSPGDNPREIKVGASNGAYQTIGEALRAAATGDVIVIYPGVYEENLSITKEVTLRGVDRDSVIIRSSDDRSPVLYYRFVEDFKVENLTILSAGRALQISSSSGQILNCRVVGNRVAIGFTSDDNDLLVKNTVISVLEEEAGEEKPQESLAGLHAFGDGRVYVESCTVRLSGTGLLLSGDMVFRLDRNTISDNRIGVSFTGRSTGLAVNNSVFSNSDIGILLNSTGVVALTSNTFSKNGNYGLALYLRMCTECRCGGLTFRGEVIGSDNTFDSTNDICPEDHEWPEGFSIFSETTEETS